MNHKDVLVMLHLGREQFYSQQEFERIASSQYLRQILDEFGSWRNACEYLRKEHGFDLEMPAIEYEYIPRNIAEIVETLNEIKVPTDFSHIEHVREAMLACIQNFYDVHKFIPTIDQARGEYKQYFPNVYHYLETFGTWHNACKLLPNVKPEQLPNFGQELKTTVNYYNRKFGKEPGTLMLEKDWNRMVEKLGKEKNIPTASHIINYVVVDRRSRGRDTPNNGWQAVAEEARLNVDKRGRPQEFARLYDRDKILKNYVGACVKNGAILTLQGWKTHCINTNRSYRPPDANCIKELFGSIKNLQKAAEQCIRMNNKYMKRFMAMKEIVHSQREVAASYTISYKENNIWQTIENLPVHNNDISMEVGRYLH